MLSANVSKKPAQRTLRADHEELAALTKRALAIVEEGDSADVQKLVAEIETKLLEHIDGEEAELLPRYAEEHPEDAGALLAQHATFRRLFAELGVAGDLHLVRLERMRELAATLADHAKRENEGLYRWAARAVKPPSP
jgi:hemerythrin superfamily protein